MMSPSHEPSMVGKVVRQGLVVYDRVLPGKTGRTMRDGAFAVYRKLVRLAYLRRPLLSSLTGDKAGAERGKLVFQVMPYSLVGWKGLEVTHRCVTQAHEKGLRGDLVECGVARGGSAAMMALVNERFPQPATLWLFDSYEGLPDPTAEDFEDDSTGSHVRPLPKGACLGTYEGVAALLYDRLRLPRERVKMVRGWFQDTLPATVGNIGAISILRLDGDWYESTKCCLEHLYDKVLPGGFVIADDYHSCFGCTRAVDEFLAQRGLKAEITPDGRGGAFFVKP
jgi:O-methyltransferase